MQENSISSKNNAVIEALHWVFTQPQKIFLLVVINGATRILMRQSTRCALHVTQASYNAISSTNSADIEALHWVFTQPQKFVFLFGCVLSRIEKILTSVCQLQTFYLTAVGTRCSAEYQNMGMMVRFYRYCSSEHQRVQCVVASVQLLVSVSPRVVSTVNDGQDCQRHYDNDNNEYAKSSRKRQLDVQSANNAESTSCLRCCQAILSPSLLWSYRSYGVTLITLTPSINMVSSTPFIYMVHLKFAGADWLLQYNGSLFQQMPRGSPYDVSIPTHNSATCCHQDKVIHRDRHTINVKKVKKSFDQSTSLCSRA
jgi:hypothetical protein